MSYTCVEMKLFFFLRDQRVGEYFSYLGAEECKFIEVVNVLVLLLAVWYQKVIIPLYTITRV